MIQETKRTGWSGLGFLFGHLIGLPLLAFLLLYSISNRSVAGVLIVAPTLLLFHDKLVKPIRDRLNTIEEHVQFDFILGHRHGADPERNVGILQRFLDLF